MLQPSDSRETPALVDVDIAGRNATTKMGIVYGWLARLGLEKNSGTVSN